jgi:hypothetical protein
VRLARVSSSRLSNGLERCKNTLFFVKLTGPPAPLVRLARVLSLLDPQLEKKTQQHLWGSKMRTAFFSNMNI